MNGGDPSFKLFGRKIHVPESQIHVGDMSTDVLNPEFETSTVKASKEPVKSDMIQHDREECRASMKSSEIRMSSKVKEELLETNSTDEEKVVKRPDKILPCPRCNSLATKFCYFNNYNVNQPRHFCKNCQRYWTAGGTMRNVPIGAWRRKNKYLASQYRQIIVSAGGVPVTRSQIDSPVSATQQFVSPGETTTAMGNGSVLKFGAEAPLSQSMETVHSLGDQKRCIEMGTVREDHYSCGSAVMPCGARGSELPGNVMLKEQIGMGGPNEPNTMHPPKGYPLPPHIFPWNQGPNIVAPPVASGQCSLERTGAPNDAKLNAIQWCPAPMVSVPGFCPPNIPLQFVPAYWGCMSVWAPVGGNVSTKGSNGCQSPSSSTSTSCSSGNGLPTLGKHHREANFVKEEQSEKCILVPKILRINDPNEASRSPIWATLGIKPGQKDPFRGGKIFNAFESKVEGIDHLSDGIHILEANPAALSRSHTFQEST